MKEAAQSYFSFHRSQRLGLIIFMSLLLILLSGLAIIHFYSIPQPTATEVKLAPIAEDSLSAEE